MSTVRRPPFPYFGGKGRIASLVWERFGDTPNFVEPFFGSGAVLLARPDAHRWWERTETVNDADGYLCNFWRAVQHDPEAVAYWADGPVNECDLHARHAWLIGEREALTARLMADPDVYDAKHAGWWVWGICQWIGRGWCASVWHQLPHLGDAGQGIHRPSHQLPHLGDAGQGIHRPAHQLPHLGDAGQGIAAYLSGIAARLRGVRVVCGDWTRVVGPSVTYRHGLTAVFLDPPYCQAERASVYAVESPVSGAVREWAIANGDNPKLRIALCGYAGEHRMPDDWRCVAWKTPGGYGGQGNGRGRDNAGRERVWFSPHCLQPERQATLWHEGVTP